MKDLLKKISTLSLLVTTLLSGNLWVEARTIPTQIHSNRASVQQFNNPVSIGAVVRAIEDSLDNLNLDNFCFEIGSVLATTSNYEAEGSMMFVVGSEQKIGLFQVFPLSSASTVFTADSILLQSVTYNCESEQLSVTSRPYGTQMIIPNVVSLPSAVLSYSVTTSNLNTLSIAFSGDWSIGESSIRIKAMYEDGTTTITGSPSGSGSVDFVQLTHTLTGIDVSGLLGASLSVSDLTLQGSISESSDTTFTMSTTGGSTKAYIIFQMLSEEESAIYAVAGELTDIRLATLVREITFGSVDISSIPYFGSVTIPGVGLSYSSTDIENIPPNLFEASPLLSINGESLVKGTITYLLFSLAREPITMTVNGTMLTFTPAPSTVSVRSLLNVIPGINLNAIPLPPGIGDLLDLYIFDIEIDTESDTIAVTVAFPGSLSFFDGNLNIGNIAAIIVIDGQDVDVEILGEVDFAGTVLLAGIEQNDDDKCQFFAVGERLPLSSVATQLQAEVLPDELSSLTNSLPSVSINDPNLIYILDSSPLQMQVGGTPAIGGLSTVRMDAVVIRQSTKTQLVQGYEIGSINLVSLLNQLMGYNFDSWAILNQNIQAAVLISPATLKNVQLMGDTLSTFVVQKGISLQASMGLPSNCDRDPFCAVIQTFLGADASFTFQGVFESLQSISFVAGVADINLGGGIVLSETGLEVQVSAGTTSIGMVGIIDLSDPDITLAGRIFVGLSGVTLEITLSGCWENAFGADWLDICNLLGSVSLVPGVPSPLTAIEVGGMVRLGYETCGGAKGNQIVASGFVGLDAINPSNNYYYVNIEDEVTMNSILRSFCINFDVLRPLAESGFPRGFISSFSLFGAELPHIPLSIPQGFRYSGAINILGLESSCNITIGFPDGLEYAIQLPPLHVGAGLLTMTASKSDKSKGPFMSIDLELLPIDVNIEASGYVNVLGISLESTMMITNDKYELSIRGKMLNLFEASLILTAAYGNIATSQFQVRGEFTNGLYDQIVDKIRDVLQASADEATRAIDAAQEDVDNARRGFESAQNALKKAERDVESAEKAFNAAAKDLQKAQDDVDNACKIKNCGNVCTGCFSGTKCCGKAFGKCICRTPKWKNCCNRIPDPVCESENAACRALRGSLNAILATASETVKAAGSTLEVAQLALVAARATVAEAEVALDAANAILEATKQAYRLGAKAAELIADYSINGLISIRNIKFDVKLSVAAGGRFSGSVRARFLGGVETTVTLDINMNDVTSMASQLADHIDKGLSGLF